MTWSFDNRCDRILWYGKGVKQISYFRSESKFSDHRPVSALFTTKIEVVKCANRRAVAPEPVVPSGGSPTKIVSHSATFISHSKNIYFLKLELAYQKYQISSKINTLFFLLLLFFYNDRDRTKQKHCYRWLKRVQKLYQKSKSIKQIDDRWCTAKSIFRGLRSGCPPPHLFSAGEGRAKEKLCNNDF